MFMFLCAHRHSNLIIYLAVQQTQALLFHDQLPVGWGGVGNNVHVPEHPQAQQPHHLLAVQQTQKLLFHDQLPVGWGWVGWGNNVHVPVRTQARQPHHLPCCPADTGTALSWSVTGGVGWGGVITFMFLSTHRHSNLIIFLAVQQTQALLFHDQLPVGWGWVGWGNNVHVPVHTQALLMISYRWGGMGWGGVITFMFLCTHRHSNLIIIIIITVITIIRTPASACTTELVSRVHNRVGFRVHNRGPNRQNIHNNKIIDNNWFKGVCIWVWVNIWHLTTDLSLVF